MLDTNTNKVTWIGVAIGVVALLGIGSTQLFPEAMSQAPVLRTVLRFTDYEENLLKIDGAPVTVEHFSAYGDLLAANEKSVLSQEDDGSIRIHNESGAKNRIVGMFLGRRIFNGPDGFMPGDKFEFQADIKIDNPDLEWYTESNGFSGFGLEKSKETWVENPPLSSEYQHYRIRGERYNNWGTVAIYLRSHTDKPVNVHIKNMKLVRIN